MKESALSLHGVLMCSIEGVVLRGDEVHSRGKIDHYEHNISKLIELQAP